MLERGRGKSTFTTCHRHQARKSVFATAFAASSVGQLPTSLCETLTSEDLPKALMPLPLAIGTDEKM